MRISRRHMLKGILALACSPAFSISLTPAPGPPPQIELGGMDLFQRYLAHRNRLERNIWLAKWSRLESQLWEVPREP